MYCRRHNEIHCFFFYNLNFAHVSDTYTQTVWHRMGVLVQTFGIPADIQSHWIWLTACVSTQVRNHTIRCHWMFVAPTCRFLFSYNLIIYFFSSSECAFMWHKYNSHSTIWKWPLSAWSLDTLDFIWIWLCAALFTFLLLCFFFQILVNKYSTTINTQKSRVNQLKDDTKNLSDDISSLKDKVECWRRGLAFY